MCVFWRVYAQNCIIKMYVLSFSYAFILFTHVLVTHHAGNTQGERADAIRQRKLSSLKILNQQGGLPSIHLPRCNGKTAPREVPIVLGLASLLLA